MKSLKDGLRAMNIRTLTASIRAAVFDRIEIRTAGVNRDSNINSDLLTGQKEGVRQSGKTSHQYGSEDWMEAFGLRKAYVGTAKPDFHN